jgi:hypothetical protein
MFRTLLAAAVLASSALPGIASAQEGEKFDCVVASIPSETRASIGDAMAGGGDVASREALFKDLGTVTDACVARHGITDEQKGIYFDYSLARISREWLAADIGKLDLPPAVVDKALDFGPGGANPDLSGDMTEEQVMKIVQAYIESGVDIDKIDGAVWEKVGAYAAATSIYWNKRKQLPF